MNAKLALFLTWFGLAALAAGYAIAASNQAPSQFPGCVYNSAPPTLSEGQRAVLTCDSTGKLRVTTSF